MEDKAKKTLKNPKKFNKVLGQAEEKVKENPTLFAQILDDLKSVIRLLRAWKKGEYKSVKTRTIILCLGALIYFISPIDAIFDFLPGGLIDDFTLLTFVLKDVRSSLKKFQEWEQTKDI